MNDIVMIAYTTPSIMSPGVMSPHQLPTKSPSSTSSTPYLEASTSTVDLTTIQNSVQGTFNGELVETMKEIKQLLIDNSSPSSSRF